MLGAAGAVARIGGDQSCTSRLGENRGRDFPVVKRFRRGFGRKLRPTHYVFAAVLAVRLLALARLTASPFLLPTRGDMSFYNDWAQRILHGQWSDHLTFYGLPGYAYLLAALYKIFGYGPFVPGLLQAGLDAGTATLLYKIGERVFGGEEPVGAAASANSILQHRGQFIGLAAAAGWALFVPAQAYSIILMPTAWLVFVFWFLVWRIVDWNRPPALAACVAYGLLIGITTTGIATILFLVPLLIASVLLRGDRKILRQAGATAALVVGITAGTAPCWIHNYFVARDPVFLSAHSGINFWIGNNPVANGYPRIPPGLRAGQSAMLQDSISVAESAAGHPLKRSAVSNYWSAKARDYIRGHFGEWLRLLATKLRNFWNAFQYDDLSIVTGLTRGRRHPAGTTLWSGGRARASRNVPRLDHAAPQPMDRRRHSPPHGFVVERLRD